MNLNTERIILLVSFIFLFMLLCTPPNNPFKDIDSVDLKIEVPKKPDGFKYCVDEKVRFKVTVIMPHHVKKVIIHYDENGDKDEKEITTNKSDNKVIFFDYEYKEKGLKNVSFTVTFRESGNKKNYAHNIDIGVKPTIRNKKNLSTVGVIKPGNSLILTVDHEKFSKATYKWYKDSKLLSGQDQQSLIFNTLKESDAGQYYCMVSTDWGKDQSKTFNLNFKDQLNTPKIQVHPQSIQTTVGNGARFFIKAIGDSIKYQWQKNGEDIPNAHDYFCEVNDLKTEDSAAYRCIISNYGGRDTSENATLKVIKSDFDTAVTILSPLIMKHPENQKAEEGDTVQFSIEVEGTNLMYQWFKNGEEIESANKADFILYPVLSKDSGNYYCIIVNDKGKEISNVATLTVKVINNPPKWKQELVDIETKEGIKVSVNLLNYFDKDPDGDQVAFLKKSGPGLIESDGKTWSWIPNFNAASSTPTKCIITAKDNGNPSMSSNMTISITVIDSVCRLYFSVVSGKGTITTNPTGPNFTPGTDVQIIAVPEKEYVFKSWSGDIDNADPMNSSIQITMNSSKNVSAIFVKVAETVVLDIGESYVHGLKYVNGYYYASTQNNPSKLLRFNANDLSDYSEITFSSKHNTADDLVYAEKKGKIYVVFAADTGLRIAEVDPYTMEYNEDKIVDMTNFTYSGQTITTDNEFLYVGARYDRFVSKIIKYSLSTLSNTPVKEVFLAPSYYSIHSIQYRNGYLYVTGTATPPWVLKVDANTLSVEQEANIDGQSPADDFVLTNDYLFVGLETDYNHEKSGVIYRISTNDISKMYPIYTGVKGGEKKGSGFCYAVQYCVGYVWALFSSSPGVLTRIDPVSLDFQNFQLEHNSPNEIATDGRRLLLTFWGQNPGRVQAFDPSYLNGREIDVN